MLDERERQILSLVAQGLANGEIADRSSSRRRRRRRAGQILDKLGLRDRAQAVVFAYRTGLARSAGSVQLDEHDDLIRVPEGGEKLVPGQPAPDHPIVPFIEGDGIGVDITPVMKDVVDAAVEKAYGGAREIQWMEIYAGEKSTRVYGADEWLPQETLEAVREYSVAIKGPMTTPVGGGMRSLNVALRQELDLFVCLRPVRWFRGVPSPLKDPAAPTW